MVAVQSYPETAASVVSRRTNERLAGVIPLEPWNFRDGRGRKFDMFKQSLTRAVKLLNIDYVFTQRTVDSFETFQAWYTLSRKLATRAHSQSVREGYDDYVLNFQIDISVLYHLLAKATDIITDNEDWKEDAEAVNAMIAGSVADGVLFYEWLMKKVDVTGLDAQAELRLLIANVVVSPSCTVSQFKILTRALLDNWLLLNHTDIAVPAQFYDELKRILPKNPPTSHVGQTRTRLCNMLADKVDMISDPKMLIKTLATFAADIGMPAGDGEDMAMFVGGGGNGGGGGGGKQRIKRGRAADGILRLNFNSSH